MDFSFIVQARVGSTRLPNKILLPFYEQNCILDLLVRKLSQVSANIIIATSQNTENDILEEKAKAYGVPCFRGSENDVLQRFIDAAMYYNVQRIIRVCSDNPFLDLESIRILTSYVERSTESYDYVSFCVNGVPSIKTHYGFWTEYVTLDALRKVVQYTEEPLYHEHVTNYIYMHSALFNTAWLPVSKKLETHNNIRLTIDTLSDFENVKKLYSELCSKNPYPSIDSVVDYLDFHSEYYSLMKEQISNNLK